MAKDNTIQSEDITVAIGLLKKASIGWPEGYANSLLREILQKAELDLKEELYKAEINKKDKKRNKTARKTGSLKE